MTKILALLLISIQFAYAVAEKTYLLEWKENITPLSKKSALKILNKNGKKFAANSWKLRMRPSTAKALKETNAFEYIEENKVYSLKNIEIAQEKMSSFMARDWHLDRMKVKETWKITKGSPSVIVAICDSGINQDLRAFKGKVLKGWNFIDGNTDTSPNTSHGTAVASYVAASGLNGAGISGIAPDVTLLPGKIVTKTGGVPTSAMLGCIRWAANQGAKVINVSMTGVNEWSSQSAARYANQKGAVVIWAAGNQNYSTRWTDKKEIIAVAGSDLNNRRYQAGDFGSNTGYFVDITAPGEGVYFLSLDGSYRKSNGTSFSAPMIAAAAALLYSIKPDLTPAQVLRYLQRGARYLGNKRSFGAGLVDVRKSIELLQNAM